MSNVVTVKKILETIEKAHLVNDVNALALDRPLSEQGVDSLDFSGILFNLEEVFGVEIPDEDIASLQTINSILIYINRKK
jgi:acyl carrier protein